MVAIGEDVLYTFLHCPHTVLPQLWPQSRQSAKLFSSRRNWDSPNPSPAGECAPPVLGGGAHSLAREGLGEPQFRRGDIHMWYSLYIRTLWLWRKMLDCERSSDRPAVPMLVSSGFELSAPHIKVPGSYPKSDVHTAQHTHAWMLPQLQLYSY
jgi:hypothetical protein